MPVHTALTYEEARDIAANDDPSVRENLARRSQIPPEVLYYLAQDERAEVRRAVADNAETPAKGNLLLADDADETVRAALAGKIERSSALLAGDGRPRSQSIMGDVLDRLARDQVVRVRAIIAHALKDVAGADAEVIRRLARDSEIIVAAPILQYSPVLTDDDLLELIAANPVEGALGAISRRSFVGGRVTSAIIASGDTTAITHLLKNANATLQEGALDALIERSAEETAWQEPLVYRRELTQRSAQRLAEVVMDHLLERILARNDLSPEAMEAVTAVVRDRLDQDAAQPPVETLFAADVETRFAPFLEKARELHLRGELDETVMMVSLLTDHFDDVVAALAVRADAPVQAVLDIVAAHSPRAICALAWSAGLTPAFAMDLQLRLAGVTLDRVLKPQARGGYPLSEGEMSWQLEMFGCPSPS